MMTNINIRVSIFLHFDRGLFSKLRSRLNWKLGRKLNDAVSDICMAKVAFDQAKEQSDLSKYWGKISIYMQISYSGEHMRTLNLIFKSMK